MNYGGLFQCWFGPYLLLSVTICLSLQRPWWCQLQFRQRQPWQRTTRLVVSMELRSPNNLWMYLLFFISFYSISTLVFNNQTQSFNTWVLEWSARVYININSTLYDDDLYNSRLFTNYLNKVQVLRKPLWNVTFDYSYIIDS